MYQFLDKIRKYPENIRKTIAASIVTVIMIALGWIWILTIKDNFDFNPVNETGEESISVISPLKAIKENFAAIKELPTRQNPANKTRLEDKNNYFFDKIKTLLDKGWHWAYDPIKP